MMGPCGRAIDGCARNLFGVRNHRDIGASIHTMDDGCVRQRRFWRTHRAHGCANWTQPSVRRLQAHVVCTRRRGVNGARQLSDTRGVNATSWCEWGETAFRHSWRARRGLHVKWRAYQALAA
eukprot:216703-Chlamydomonas_euryale.AAC.1